MSGVNVYVATHKSIEHDLPKYCKKVQVNCNKQEQLWDGYIHDNEGDNISDKNYSYSELTVIYWAWKNSDADVKGICHYRRYFTRYTNDTLIPIYKLDCQHMLEECLTEEEIKARLECDCDMILTKPYAPYPETVREEMEKYVYKKDLDTLCQVIEAHYPEYSDTLEQVMNSHNISFFNMCIATDKVFNQYCEWLFAVLQQVEAVIDISQYDKQHQRLYGYLAEILLNVYVQKNGLRCCYYKMGFLEYGDSLYKKIKIYLLRKRSSLHERLYRNNMYGVVEGIYKIFHKSAYEKLKVFKAKGF